MYKVLRIEFIRPISLNGNYARYHTLTDIDSVTFTDRLLDLRTSSYAFRCPLPLVKFFQFETSSERIV